MNVADVRADDRQAVIQASVRHTVELLRLESEYEVDEVRIKRVGDVEYACQVFHVSELYADGFYVSVDPRLAGESDSIPVGDSEGSVDGTVRT